MGIFSRGRRLPAELAGVSGVIPDGERVKAWASGPVRLDGEPTLVVATDLAVYSPGYFGRVPWEQVMRVTWDDPILEFVMTNPAGSTDLARITLDAAGSIPQLVYERVTATIVMQRHIKLIDSRGATLVARRVRGSDEIRWEVVFDAGVDPSDPEMRARADEQLGWLRDSAGI
jgi:hypothetical protein